MIAYSPAPIHGLGGDGGWDFVQFPVPVKKPDWQFSCTLHSGRVVVDAGDRGRNQGSDVHAFGSKMAFFRPNLPPIPLQIPLQLVLCKKPTKKAFHNLLSGKAL